MSKHPISRCLATIGAFFILASASMAADLVTFDRNLIAQAQALGGITVFAKLDHLAAALVEPDKYPELFRLDPSAKIIESPADLEFLYLADKGGPVDGDILLETENRMIVRLTPSEAERLMGRGTRLVKCLPFDLPPDKPIIDTPMEIYVPGLAADLDSLMALVSVDSIRAYVQRLEDFRTRYSNTDSFWASADWIAGKFTGWGYDSLEIQNFDIWNIHSCNVIASKLGTVFPDRVIVIGGHFDSVVYDGGDPTIYAPGADDNGSGTAFTLEIARVLATMPFKKTVRFIAFGAEEQGIFGSQAYVNRALQRGENIEVMINADMIGNSTDDEPDFNVKCNRIAAPYGQILSDIASQNTPLIPYLLLGNFSGSDHVPFGEAGFRTVYSDEGDFSPNWHFQTDVIGNMNIPYMTDIVRANLGLLVTAIGVPPPVTGLAAHNAGDGHAVYLSWAPLADPDIVGYEIYRGYSENSLTIIDTITTPTDTIRGAIEDSTLYFAVTGITTDGSRSLIDDIVSITPRSHPARPDTLTVEPDFGRVTVRWASATDLDFSHYQLWRCIGTDGDYVPYQQLSNPPEYIDNGLVPNTRYYYRVTIVDTTGFSSEPSRADYSKILSLDSGILLVDEYQDGTGNQGQPTDAQQDSFYAAITALYDADTYDIQDEGVARINDLGAYSTVVYFDEDPTNHYFTAVQPDLIRYLSLGGNLLFTGWRAFSLYGNGRPLTFNAGQFPYDYLKISSVNISSIAVDFSGAIGLSDWPNLNVFPGRVLAPWNGRILGVDAFTLREGADPIYTYNSFYGDTLVQGRPVGIVVAESTWNIAYFSFPFYAMDSAAAREAFGRVMALFGEQTPVSRRTIRAAPENISGPELPQPVQRPDDNVLRAFRVRYGEARYLRPSRTASSESPQRPSS